MRTCSPTRFAVALLEAVLEDDGPPDLPTELEGQPFLLATMIANMGRDGEGAGGAAASGRSAREHRS